MDASENIPGEDELSNFVRPISESEYYMLIDTKISSILDDCLYNIMSDAVLQVHREEKMARMDTAAILASQDDNEGIYYEDVSDITKTPLPKATVTVDGKHYLKYNPLRSIRQNHCTSCRLPIFQEPYIIPMNSAVCAKHSYECKPNHEIFGQSPKAVSNPIRRTKPYRTLPFVSPPDSPSTLTSSMSKIKGGHNPAVPSAKCPNCPRMLGVSRMAQHLDKCLGLSGRRSGRAHLPKIRLRLNVTPQKRKRCGRSEEDLEIKRKSKKIADFDSGADSDPDKDDNDDDDESWEDIRKRTTKTVKSQLKKRTGGKSVRQPRRGSIKTVPGYRSTQTASEPNSQLDDIDSADTLR